LILTGTNSYSGGTTVSFGTLQGNTASLQGDITNNSHLIFNQTSDGIYVPALNGITGTGDISIQGGGRLINILF
jgi:fibronectin-binding autotransporter adhesin